MKAVSLKKAASAIREGDVDRLRALLEADPSLATATTRGNPRTLLHHATDWPGKRPNVGESIALLVSFGADPNAGADFGSPPVAETPLHWAASADDLEAATALLRAGADVDAVGGLFGGCTPFEEAIIFQNLPTARLLLEHGATNYLPGAAALGQLHEIDRFFTDGTVDVEACRLPHWTVLPRPQDILDRAFQFACRAGHLDIAEMLLERGADHLAVSPADTTAIDEARANGHTAVVRWLDDLA